MSCFVTHLESALDGTRFAAGELHTTHEGRPLWVRYDLDAVRRAVARDDLAHRPSGMWRYRELLPHRDAARIVSLGEPATPLLDCPRLGAALGLEGLLVKDESRLPTGSFKARGMAMAVTMARELGVRAVCVPTAGNAGGALAAYAARAGLRCHLAMPRDTPVVNRLEGGCLGAECILVDGLISDCGPHLAAARERGAFDMSTLKEPYRLEGKKTMGLELAEQLGWTLPDAILYPTGGGTGLVGMWKAFDELAALGWIDGARRPRMYACQSDGCAPIARAFAAGERFAPRFPDAHTIASGLRVPMAVGDFMILDAVRASGGAALAVPESSIMPWTRRACAEEGVSICPETGACLAALEMLVRDGRVGRHERVVVFNTGALQKYVEAMHA